MTASEGTVATVINNIWIVTTTGTAPTGTTGFRLPPPGYAAIRGRTGPRRGSRGSRRRAAPWPDRGRPGPGRARTRVQSRHGPTASVSRSRALTLPLALGAATMCGCVAVAAMNPGDDGVPLCWSRSVFGVDCPFCGGLRATNALLRGQFRRRPRPQRAPGRRAARDRPDVGVVDGQAVARARDSARHEVPDVDLRDRR